MVLPSTISLHVPNTMNIDARALAAEQVCVSSRSSADACTELICNFRPQHMQVSDELHRVLSEGVKGGQAVL